MPNEVILSGDETDRLHRWGYARYRDMFNERQLLGLELSCQLIHGIADRRIRAALATNLSDLLRYQNMLCRYDTMALKSLDIFSVHGFPVGLVQCESNLLGIVNGNGVNVGSGGWTNIKDKYARAKRYCEEPFEIQRRGSKNVQIPMVGEWIGEKRAGSLDRSVDLKCLSATELVPAPESLDAVFTDPPYFGNVQYGELMDFCYVWLRQLVQDQAPWFDLPSSRSHDELTENITAARGVEHFTEGLSAAYTHMARALKTVLADHGISYRKTKRAERVSGFDQAPDFIIPNEFNPSVIIEAKLTEDDGTVRDKVTRVQHLRSMSLEGQPSNRPRYEVVACIAVRGFGVRREDMKKLLIATQGKVFTLQNLPRLIEHTKLQQFVTKTPPASRSSEV